MNQPLSRDTEDNIVIFDENKTCFSGCCGICYQDGGFYLPEIGLYEMNLTLCFRSGEDLMEATQGSTLKIGVKVCNNLAASRDIYTRVAPTGPPGESDKRSASGNVSVNFSTTLQMKLPGFVQIVVAFSNDESVSSLRVLNSMNNPDNKNDCSTVSFRLVQLADNCC